MNWRWWVRTVQSTLVVLLIVGGALWQVGRVLMALLRPAPPVSLDTARFAQEVEAIEAGIRDRVEEGVERATRDLRAEDVPIR